MIFFLFVLNTLMWYIAINVVISFGFAVFCWRRTGILPVPHFSTFVNCTLFKQRYCAKVPRE